MSNTIIDLRTQKLIEERHYLVMPFNNKWYKLKKEFTVYATNSKETVQKRCEYVYRSVCSDYTNKNIAIMEIETRKAFVFNLQHDGFGNLQKVTCNDFSQFEQMN